jgi:hypothetical protein
MQIIFELMTTTVAHVLSTVIWVVLQIDGSADRQDKDKLSLFGTSQNNVQENSGVLSLAWYNLKNWEQEYTWKCDENLSAILYVISLVNWDYNIWWSS